MFLNGGKDVESGRREPVPVPVQTNNPIPAPQASIYGVPASISTTTAATNDSFSRLLPLRNNTGRFNVDLLGTEAISCSGLCWMNWFCCCCTLGTMTERLKAAGTSIFPNSYCGVMAIYLIIVILATILTASLRNGVFFYLFLVWFVAIMISQIRSFVRHYYGIEGDTLTDFCVGFWCISCSINQLAHQLWVNPEYEVGCVCGPDAAYVESGIAAPSRNMRQQRGMVPPPRMPAPPMAEAAFAQQPVFAAARPVPEK